MEFFTAILKHVKIGSETKPPILEWDKTADFENGTKSPILKWDKTADLL